MSRARSRLGSWRIERHLCAALPRPRAVARAVLPVVGAVCMIGAAQRANAASFYDPAYRFSTLRTGHFVIYFHAGEYPLATRLAGIAEEAWRALEHALGARPPLLTHIVLVDQTEAANGSAYPIPYDTVVITATWPAGSEFIGDTDDWLRLAFTHEFTHIVHLDRSEGWARGVRRLFGRVPVAFPNLFLPIWHIEGLATYEESAITGEGRLHAGDFRAIVDEAARTGRLEPMHRVNGGLTDWPGGLAPYAYGLGFHAYLAERYGDEKFGALADATARMLPYTASRVFERIYGQSLGTLWRSYEESLTGEKGLAASGVAALAAEPRRLTHHGFTVLGPRFAASACAGCANQVIYSVRTPYEFPSLNAIDLDGSRPRRIVTRYLGSTLAVGRRFVYFDQQELRRSVGLYSDLYSLDRTTNRVHRLTLGARLLDPDLSPDERTIVAVRAGQGRRQLVLIPLAPGAPWPRAADIIVLASGPDLQFNTPRWSPDGRSIAVERHARGSQSEISVVDAATGAMRTIASDPGSRWVTPAWTPDGRAIVASSDRGGPFNLYEIDVDGQRGPRQLTFTTGGATWPDVSPDGTAIVYVGYTVDGFDLFETPYPNPTSQIPNHESRIPIRLESRLPTPHESQLPNPDSEIPGNPEPQITTRKYTPWSTLRPTSWSPIVTADRTQARIGAATSGTDVLGYHAYAASATWNVLRPTGTPQSNAAEPDWQVSYAYARWRPTLFAAASSATSFFAGPPTDAGLPSTTTLRERQLQAGTVFPMHHVRVSSDAIVSLARTVDDFIFVNRDVLQNRTAARFAWSLASAHTYGYSISPEKGLAVGITTELVRRALGAAGDATTSTLDARAYLPGLSGNHVVAIRFAAGLSSGERNLRRTFLLGGAGPDPVTVDFGSQAINLLRGFPVDTFAGNDVALLNAEYRWPIARPQHGLGTWPLLVHTIHTELFVDAGQAWTRTFDIGGIKSSCGAELSLDVVLGYSFPVTVAAGAAWGHDASHIVPDRGSVYVRVGRSF